MAKVTITLHGPTINGETIDVPERLKGVVFGSKQFKPKRLRGIGFRDVVGLNRPTSVAYA